MKRAMTLRIGSIIIGVFVWSSAPDARAEGSNGMGGSIGSRMDWPCEGCRFLTPDQVDFSQPIPLMVTFHGDEGDPQYIHSSFSNASKSANVILLSLKCPAELGCQDATYDIPGSWYEWRRTATHDPEWVGRQVDAVQAQYNIELNQVYLAGFSGGSIYTSWYALEYADRYAGVNYLGGGSPPRDGCTASCPIPAYFLIGSEDFLLDGATRMRDYMTGCMHEVQWDEVPGVDHTIIRDNLPQMLQWMLARPHMCRGDGDESSGSTSGGSTSTTDTSSETSASTSSDTSGGDATSTAETSGGEASTAETSSESSTGGDASASATTSASGTSEGTTGPDTQGTTSGTSGGYGDGTSASGSGWVTTAAPPTGGNDDGDDSRGCHIATTPSTWGLWLLAMVAGARRRRRCV